MTARDRDAPLASPGGGSNQSRVLGDVTSFIANVSSSVLIVFVNKVLMDPRHGYGFSFATCLCALHFFTSALSVKLAQCLGFGQHASLPFKDTLFFSTVAGTSISSLNLSLLVNSVGFYQISKLLIIPFVVLVEAVWLKKRFTIPVIFCVLTVILGVGIVTVTDVQVNSLGLFIAGLSVVTSGMQQILCGTVQRKHNLTSTQLLANTAPVQGMLLLCLGPFIDQLVSKQWILDYQYSVPGLQVLAVSCVVAVAVNVSQFMCLGRFSALTFQVLGHAKTVIVLLIGWLYFHDRMNERKLVGMVLAVAGMIGYGYLTSKQTQKQGGMTRSMSANPTKSGRLLGLNDKDKADYDLVAEQGEANGTHPQTARGTYS